MGDPYEKVKGGRLTFKGGGLATLSKSIDKKKKKKNKKNKNKDEHKSSLDEASEFLPQEEAGGGEGSAAEKTTAAGVGGEIYTIDAAKRMQYEELFPVEAKKLRYEPKSSNLRSAEVALDDRVKKKADRYCK